MWECAQDIYSFLISFLSDSTTSCIEIDEDYEPRSSIVCIYLDNDDERRLEEHRVCFGIKDGCRRLERLEETGDVA